MSRRPDFWLDSPPVWELGMTVQTATRGMMDNYDVKGVHDLFRAEYPTVERHEPVILQPETVSDELGPDTALYRWWFLSGDGEMVIQAQEDMTARNWRRRELPPVMPHPYPGYVNMREGFRAQVDQLASLRPDKELPKPAFAELLYDNFLLLKDDKGEQLTTSEVLAPVNFPVGSARAAFTMGWFEPIPDAGDNAALRVQISAHSVAIHDEEPVPVVRLNLSARKPVDAWPKVFEFFDAGHEFVRQRFLELTTERCHTIWGLR